jgi:hypothetical protein
MSRKAILSLATVTIIAVGLASTAADARGFGGGFGGGHVASARSLGGGNQLAGRGNVNRLATLTPGRGGRGGHPGHGGLHGHHHHRIFRNGIWIDVDGYAEDYVEAPVVATSGPCTCLTKTYTKDGLVVFADVCTKEAASARIDGTATGAIDVPTDGKAVAQQPTSPNYAGRTYADFLAANSQAASQAAQKN